MNTRSRGTSTSSKITNASCSSKRVDSGRSKRSLPGAEALSRHRNTSPGVSIGMLKLSAYSGGAPGGSGWPGYTASSSANGARVARMRAPRTTIPWAVVPTLCNGTALPANAWSVARSTVGWMIVCVRRESSRASCRWKATRWSWPAVLRPSAPIHAARSPANPANVTFR